MRISKEEFIKAMEAIKKQQGFDDKQAQTASDYFGDAFPGNLLYNNFTISNAFIELLMALTNDKNTITHFIFETNWGKENCVVLVDKEPYQIKNISDLYDFLEKFEVKK